MMDKSHLEEARENLAELEAKIDEVGDLQGDREPFLKHWMKEIGKARDLVRSLESGELEADTTDMSPRMAAIFNGLKGLDEAN